MMNKQIEEMAKVMHDRAHEIAEDPYGLAKILAQCKTMSDDFAEVLYNKGYRKSSDIFEAIEKLFRQRFNDEIDGEYRINAQEFADLKKKYESEGEE